VLLNKEVDRSIYQSPPWIILVYIFNSRSLGKL